MLKYASNMQNTLKYANIVKDYKIYTKKLKLKTKRLYI